jgi:hypothetical protein
MLHEHRVFTTPQLAQLAFGSQSRAAHRLLVLRRLGLITRWRPWNRARSTPWHWALDTLGAHILAAEHHTTTKTIGHRRDLAEAIFGSAQLAHQLGVNALFTALAHRTRALPPGQGLAEWWSEARCISTWGHIVRPDAYGRWTQHGHIVDFFLEHDTGTETLTRVTAKLSRYADLAHLSGITTPVLFTFPTPRRETNFRALGLPSPQVPVHTTNQTAITQAADDPSNPVWIPLTPDNQHTSQRLPLSDLAVPSAHPHRHDSRPGQGDAEPQELSAWNTRPQPQHDPDEPS